MRSFPINFAELNKSSARSPRFVVAIRYEVESVYFTSHDDIANVPGIVINSVLKEPAAISQRLVPDEGRAEIGSFSFSLVDLSSEATDALRDHLQNGQGPRSREVRFYIGYEGMDFTEFQLFTTQIIQSDSYDAGVYSFQCDDITREQNKEVFKPVATTLRQSVSATDTTIPVASTSKFQAIEHDASYSDAPNQTVGYFKLEDEIIRYPVDGRTVDSFTNCTRGVLNTLPKAHVINENAPADRQPKVEEFIYLEGPGPKLALAVLRGDGLPPNWNLGFDSAYVRETEFVNIGKDLWDTIDLTQSLILRFEGLKAQDGKRFLEKEVYLLLGCFSPVYSDGTVGLKRRSAVIADAAPVKVLTSDNIVEIGALEHDGDSMHNHFRVKWAWDPIVGDFIRESRMIDGYSIAAHGEAPLLTYEFRGLHGERHTDAILAQRLDSIRDAYNEPPLRLSVTVFGSKNDLEVGDIVRIAVPESILRDYTADTGDFNRSFEVQQMSYNAHTGAVRLDLFGSTARPIAQPPTASEDRPLTDGYYSSGGVALSTVATMSGNNMQAGTYSFTGGVTLADEASIVYHEGDLTILDGATFNYTGNLQLRVKGFVQINGDIVGTGGGKAGVADPGTGAWDATILGNPGFLGNTRGYDGLRIMDTALFGTIAKARTVPVPVTTGTHESSGAAASSWPTLELRVDGDSLVGLPTDLRGGGGGPGGRILNTDGDNHDIKGAGGTGGNGGAGLLIVCRGFAFGASGSITLDGANTASPSAVTASTGITAHPGAGAPGAPGAFLLLLDGNQIFFPAVAGKFFARAGSITQAGHALPNPGPITIGPNSGTNGTLGNPHAGFADPTVLGLSGLDYSTSAFRIQYIPESQAAAADEDDPPPPPTGLNVTGEAGFNAIRLTLPDFDQFDSVRVYASLDNDRANAVLIGEGKKAEFKHELPVLSTRYYWGQTLKFVDGRKRFSTWFPVSDTAGISAQTLNPGGWTPIVRGNCLATVSTIQKAGGVQAWDSDCYSQEAYEIGAYVSFRPAQNDKDFMMGLNVDPITDTDFTSIDRAWYCKSDGTAQIYQSGVLIGSFGSYDTSTTFAIVYDDKHVRYFKNGSVELSVLLTGVKLRLDSSFYDPGAKVLDVKFGPSPPAGLDGEDGDDGVAIGIRLSATAQIFTFDGENAASPVSQTITFTAARTGIATATTWTTTPSVTLGGSVDTRTLTVANFGANTSVKVRAEADGFFDEITVVRLRSGTDAVVGFLTNESHVVPASSSGVVSSYSGVTGTFKVFFGTTDVTTSAAFSVLSNPQALTVSGPSSSGVYSITGGLDLGEESATVTFRAVYAGRTLDKIFSLSKSKEGAAGLNGADGKDADFYDTFDHQDWASRYNNRANSGSLIVTYPPIGTVGGRVLSASGGQLWIASKANIPYDPAVIYKITARIRRTAAGSIPSQQFAYVGVEGVAANGTTLINTSGSDSSGSQHYNCFASFDLSAVALNTWVHRSAFFKGHDTSGFTVSTNVNLPTPLYTGVTYFRPLLILNYNSGNGTQECDFIRVERMPTVGTAQIDPNSVSQTVAVFDGVDQPVIATTGNPAIEIDLVTAAITITDGNVAIDGMATVEITGGTGVPPCTFEEAVLRISRNGTMLNSARWDAVAGGVPNDGGGNDDPYTSPITISATDSPPPGTYTYSLRYRVKAAGSSGSRLSYFTNQYIKLREYKR